MTASEPRKVSAQPRDLPEHVASGEEWKAWPRKTEAHVWYGARERQITALCRAGQITVWRCPDDTLRIDPSELEERYGPPGTFKGRDRAPSDPVERQQRVSARKEPEFDYADPLPGLVRELTLLVREHREEKLSILKLVVDPMNHVHKLLQWLTDHAMDRVKTMEARELDTMALYEALTSTKAEQDLRAQDAAGKSANRAEVMAMLRKALPRLLDDFATSGTLAGFVRTLDPDLVQTLLKMDVLPKDQLDKLQRAADAALKSKASAAAADNGKPNGKASAEPATTGAASQAGVS